MTLQTKIIEYYSERYPHHFLCHYRPWKVGHDKLSKSIIRFKKNELPDVKAWIECSTEALIGFTPNPTILRALNHDELAIQKSTEGPLDKLGIALANHLHGVYSPQLLSRNRITRPQKSLTRSERADETNDLYEFTLSSHPTHILVIDDITTTGQTICSIIKSIRTSNKEVPITLFTLACTDRSEVINQKISLHGHTYHWQPMKGWLAVNENDMHYQANFSALKELIHSNFDEF